MLGHEFGHIINGDFDRVTARQKCGFYCEINSNKDEEIRDRGVGEIQSVKLDVEDEKLHSQYFEEALCDIMSEVSQTNMLTSEFLLMDFTKYGKSLGIEKLLTALSMARVSVFTLLNESKPTVNDKVDSSESIGNAFCRRYPHPIVRLILIDSISRSTVKKSYDFFHGDDAFTKAFGSFGDSKLENFIDKSICTITALFDKAEHPLHTFLSANAEEIKHEVVLLYATCNKGLLQYTQTSCRVLGLSKKFDDEIKENRSSSRNPKQG